MEGLHSVHVFDTGCGPWAAQRGVIAIKGAFKTLKNRPHCSLGARRLFLECETGTGRGPVDGPVGRHYRDFTYSFWDREAGVIPARARHRDRLCSVNRSLETQNPEPSGKATETKTVSRETYQFCRPPFFGYKNALPTALRALVSVHSSDSSKTHFIYYDDL